MGKVVLHIGQQKTASTSLQKFWQKNRNSLRSQGVLYPKSLGDMKQISLLTDYDKLSDGGSSLYKKCLREIEDSNCPTVLLSEENLFVCKPHIRESIYKFLNDTFEEIELLVFLRRQEEHIPSHYQQVVKGKTHLSLDKWIHKILQVKTHYYQYDIVLSQWQNLFAKSKISLIPFNQVKSGSIHERSLELLNIDKFVNFDFNIPRENKSWDQPSVQLFQAVNSLVRQDNPIVTERTRTKLRNYLLNNQSAQGDKLVLSKAQIDKIRDKTYESNKKLIKTFDLTDADKSYFLDNVKVRDGNTVQMEDLLKIWIEFNQS